jgi:hypothetical protein
MAQRLTVFGKQLAQAFRPFWRETLLGLAVQVSVLVVLTLVWANTLYLPDLNDMGELVFLGVQNLLSGINPYGKTYTLGIAVTDLRNHYEVDAFHYGPVTLVAHLPVMLFPFRFDGLGKADIMPSFVALQVTFTFLLFWCLARMGHARFGLLFWANPFWVPTELNTFFALPLLFLLLGLQQIEQPRRCILWLSLAAATYQITAPLLVFALIYHRTQIRALVQSLAPAVLLTSLFVIWSALEGQPLQLLQDLLLSTLNRPYPEWSYVRFIPVWAMLFSVPVLAFNLFHVDYVSVWTGGALRMSSFMMLATVVIMGVLCVLLLHHPTMKRTLTYGSLVIFLLIASMPSGLGEYYVIVILPLFFLLLQTGWWARFLAAFKARTQLVATRLRGVPASPQSISAFSKGNTQLRLRWSTNSKAMISRRYQRLGSPQLQLTSAGFLERRRKGPARLGQRA